MTDYLEIAIRQTLEAHEAAISDCEPAEVQFAHFREVILNFLKDSTTDIAQKVREVLGASEDSGDDGGAAQVSEA